MPPLKVLVAQLGARQHYQIPRMCRRNDALARMHTDFWKLLPEPLVGVVRMLGRRLGARIAGRSTSDILEDELVVPHTLPAAYWYARLATARTRPEQFEVHRRWGCHFARRVARAMPSERFTTFFGFSSASLEAIAAAKELGALTVLDEIAPYHLEDEILADEQLRFPGWEQSAGATPASYLDRLEAEWHACDRIVVNSAWTRAALQQRGVDAGKVSVVPISFQPPYAAGQVKRRRGDEPLRVLWLGSLCLRKGLPYAIEAARLLDGVPVEFTFAGPSQVDPGRIRWPRNCCYVGQVPRVQARDVWNSHHVFLLPTLSDGFAITQIEAIAHGLPLIVTSACGDVVEDGRTGALVGVRDAHAIADAVSKFLDGEIDLEAASSAAIERAKDFSAEAVWRRLKPVLMPDATP